jgi:mRNA interferase MazF
LRRGELYLVKHPASSDPKRQRVFVVVSRQALIDSSFSSVVCAPVYTTRAGLATQVEIGAEHGLKHDCSVHCDELVSLAKDRLTNYVGSLTNEKLLELDLALAIALDIRDGALAN